MSSSRRDHATGPNSHKRTRDGASKPVSESSMPQLSADSSPVTKLPMDRPESAKTAQGTSTPLVPSAVPSALPSIPIVTGKRRGGKILKTGVLTQEKRAKTDDTAQTSTMGASSSKESSSNAYLEEMKKYSDQLCAEERHARPLVK